MNQFHCPLCTNPHMSTHIQFSPLYNYMKRSSEVSLNMIKEKYVSLQVISVD